MIVGIAQYDTSFPISKGIDTWEMKWKYDGDGEELLGEDQDDVIISAYDEDGTLEYSMVLRSPEYAKLYYVLKDWYND